MGKPAGLAHRPDTEEIVKKRLFSLFLAVVMISAAVPFVSAAGRGHFRILFIGNSYSEDATDGFISSSGEVYTGYSTFFNMLKTALGEGVDVEVALAMSGGKTMTWHASTAEGGLENYEFRIIGDKTNGFWQNIPEVKTTAGVLSYDDWDAVVLQPYGPEIEKGSSSPAGSTKPFAAIEDSTSFMLDYVGERVPDADVYLYLIISKTQENAYFAGVEKFDKIRHYTDIASHLTGEKTGNGFTAVVPVGTAIQNARSTYLSLHYSVDPSGEVSLETDPVTGLQRDELHVSYSVGRYIAALTFVETLVPANLQKGDPLSVDIRRPDSAYPLPDEYKETARDAVFAALDSVNNEGEERFASVDLTEWKEDPADVVANALASSPHDVFLPSGGDHGAIVSKTLETDSPGGSLIATDTGSLFREGDTGHVSVTLTFGYKTVDVVVPLVFIDHEHIWELKNSGFIHDGTSEYTEVYKCSVCGKETEKTMKKDPCPSDSLTDVPPYGDWAHDGIDFCIKNGLMKGVSSSKFEPEGTMTRAMLVTVLWRYAGEPKPKKQSRFTDLDADWYRDAVNWAFEDSVVMGTSATKFSPNDPLTREQIATILYRFSDAEKSGVTGNISGFSDYSKVSGYARDAMAWANGSGLIRGVGTVSGVLLDPLGKAMRAQVAAILSRFIGSSPEV